MLGSPTTSPCGHVCTPATFTTLMINYFGKTFNYKTVPAPDRKKTITLLKQEFQCKFRRFGIKPHEINHFPMVHIINDFFHSDIFTRSDIVHSARIYELKHVLDPIAIVTPLDKRAQTITIG